MSEFQEKSGITIVKKIEVPRLRYFNGKINHNMPLLLNGTDIEGNVVDAPRTPMTLKQLLEERVYNANAHDRDLLRNTYADIAFFEINDPGNSGEIKYVLYSQPLAKELFNSLDSRSNIKNGKLVITQDQYLSIPKEESFVITPDLANALIENSYSYPDIRRKIWVYGAEGNEDLVDENLNLVKQIVGGDFSNRMGIFPSHYHGFGSWCIGWLVVDYRSNASGRSLLDDDDGRLVGVAPKAHAEK